MPVGDEKNGERNFLNLEALCGEQGRSSAEVPRGCLSGMAWGGAPLLPSRGAAPFLSVSTKKEFSYFKKA